MRIKRWAWCLLLACAAGGPAGCGNSASLAVGADGQLPQDVILKALRAANDGHYDMASRYFTARRREELESKYAEEGGLRTYWDYMTSARASAHFVTSRVDIRREDRVTVWVVKTRKDATQAPAAHFLLVRQHNVWRIDG